MPKTDSNEENKFTDNLDLQNVNSNSDYGATAVSTPNADSLSKMYEESLLKQLISSTPKQQTMYTQNMTSSLQQQSPVPQVPGSPLQFPFSSPLHQGSNPNVQSQEELLQEQLLLQKLLLKHNMVANPVGLPTQNRFPSAMPTNVTQPLTSMTPSTTTKLQNASNINHPAWLNQPESEKYPLTNNIKAPISPNIPMNMQQPNINPLEQYGMMTPPSMPPNPQLLAQMQQLRAAQALAELESMKQARVQAAMFSNLLSAEKNKAQNPMASFNASGSLPNSTFNSPTSLLANSSLNNPAAALQAIQSLNMSATGLQASTLNTPSNISGNLTSQSPIGLNSTSLFSAQPSATTQDLQIKKLPPGIGASNISPQETGAKNTPEVSKHRLLNQQADKNETKPTISKYRLLNQQANESGDTNTNIKSKRKQTRNVESVEKDHLNVNSGGDTGDLDDVFSKLLMEKKVENKKGSSRNSPPVQEKGSKKSPPNTNKVSRKSPPVSDKLSRRSPPMTLESEHYRK